MEQNKSTELKPQKNKHYEIRWRRVKLPWICYQIYEDTQTADLLSRDRKSKIAGVKWSDLKAV